MPGVKIQRRRLFECRVIEAHICLYIAKHWRLIWTGDFHESIWNCVTMAITQRRKKENSLCIFFKLSLIPNVSFGTISSSKYATQRAFQRWINVESTSDLNVETTLKYSWIWKLDGRWNDNVESTSITWRWFNVGASMLDQRWLSNVESTSYYLYSTFNPNHNTTFICNTDAVENEIS